MTDVIERVARAVADINSPESRWRVHAERALAALRPGDAFNGMVVVPEEEIERLRAVAKAWYSLFDLDHELDPPKAEVDARMDALKAALDALDPPFLPPEPPPEPVQPPPEAT